MNDELNKVKARILNLSKKTLDNGCTEAEAMSAMAMVGRLLSQYNLSMEECDVRESKCVTIKIDIDRQRRGPMDGTITALANLVYGKCWFSTKWEKVDKKYIKKAAYAFYVQEHDADLIKYLFEVIQNALDSEAQAFKLTEDYRLANIAGSRKSAFVSFQRGMAHRISKRLGDIRNENEMAMAAGRSNGTALMVLKGQVIREEWSKEGIKLRTVSSQIRIRDGNAYGKGAAAGDKVNLSRPLGGRPAGYL